MEILREALPYIVHSLLGLAGAVGLLALVSPKMFAVVAETSGLWVATPKAQTFDEVVIDIDQFVFRNSRQFGALVVLVTGYLILFFLGRVDPSSTPPFLLVVVGLSVLLALSGLVELKGEVSKIEAQLADARIDALTGLANRRVFDDELRRRLSERSRRGTGFCVAIIDIDCFKEINDRYGHLTGDLVLTQGVADKIRRCKRTMDLAARYGGDELAIVYPSSNLQEASTAAENLRIAITEGQLPLEDTDLSVTVSIGVAEAMPDDDVCALIGRADKALYSAKQGGRNKAYRNDGDCCEPIGPRRPSQLFAD
jgi:diguanylate cyclase (GGDEF)-like protein